MPHNNDASSVPNINNPLNLENADREVRINRLREEIKKLTGEDVIFGQVSRCPPEVLEQFLEQVLEFERSPETTHLDLLARRGIHPPPPQELDDASLRDVLWKLIGDLAHQHTFVYHTNHLSDRELYSHLWNDSLREWAVDVKGNPDAAWDLDLLGGGGADDIETDMRYYADEFERARWMEQLDRKSTV